MTRDEVKAILEDAGSVTYHTWTFSKYYMSCQSCDEVEE